MWIFTTLGFYSIVRSNLEPDKYQIRARKRAHLVNLQEHMAGPFGADYLDDIIACIDADYRWRIIIAHDRLAVVLCELLALVDYTKFKPAVRHQLPADTNYEATLLPVWSTMLGLQRLEVSNG
jgi:hypothetical protein